MTISIRPLDPDLATEADLDGYFALRAAANLVDFPEDPPMTRDAVVGRLLHPPVDEGPGRHWVAYEADRMVGTSRLAYLPDGNSDILLADTKVHPEFRRRGIGRTLIQSVLPAVVESGRSTVLVVMSPGSEGTRWAAGFGFTESLRTVIQVLDVADVPAGAWDLPVPEGYRLTSWLGATPEELLASYAAARPAVQDAPLGQSSFRETAWTAELIRRTESELARNGVEERVVVALEEASGEVVGVTSMYFYPHRPQDASQHDTSVVAAHRGHGLGAVMKAAMMRWIVEERPGVERVTTGTAAANEHMLRVNRSLGYRDLRAFAWMESGVAALAERLRSGGNGAAGTSGDTEGSRSSETSGESPAG